MKFVNLTPHAVTVANGSLRITIEKNIEDPVVRIEQNVIQTTVDYELTPGIRVSIPLEAHTSYAVTGLPDPVPGVTYIVSSMVASRAKRSDVVSPITDSTCERDDSGRVISVKGFQTYTPDYRKKVTISTPIEDLRKESIKQEMITGAFAVTEETAAAVEEIVEETKEEFTVEAMVVELPPREISFKAVEKVDMMMLDPIKATARAKYEKRTAQAKIKSRR